MPAHKHAALMAQYAEDAAETETPWERWEYKDESAVVFSGCNSTPLWSTHGTYRRKPKTIMCNGFEIDAPITSFNDIKDLLSAFSACVISTDLFIPCHDWSFKGLRLYLKRGLLHTTKEAAIAHAKAMLGIDPKGE